MDLNLREIAQSLNPNGVSMADIMAGDTLDTDDERRAKGDAMFAVILPYVQKMEVKYPNEDEIFKTIMVLKAVEPDLDDMAFLHVYHTAMSRLTRQIDIEKR